MDTKKEAQKTLKKYFGYDSFRKGQEEIVLSILDKKDILAVMPTGAGKSLCYEVPALMMDGVTIVISPLISLMKDQVDTLRARGIKADFINSQRSSMDNFHNLKDAESGKLKILYVTPERLLTPTFLEVMQNVNVSMITIDEAHTVSAWGRDFRKSYLDIAKFASLLKKRPVIAAFTATATEDVKEDIKKLLRLNKPFEITTGFDRPNIFFESHHTKDKIGFIIDYLSRHEEASGIIYCITRKDCEYVSDVLRMNGFDSEVYHAGMFEDDRSKVQNDFLFDKVKLIVATNAFGMGIDKPNVTFVIHYGMPKSLEAYYQEAGRCGRNGEISEAILLYNERDIKLNEYMIEKKDEDESLTRSEKLKLKKKEYDSLNAMVKYAKSKTCLRGVLLNYFGDDEIKSCDYCSNCISKTKLSDITLETKKILRTIEQVGENEDWEMILEILRGTDSKTKKVTSQILYDKKYEKIKTFGTLKLTRDNLKELLNYLIGEEVIKREFSESAMKNVLKITDKGNKVLKDNKRIFMRTNIDYNLLKKEKGMECDKKLFDLLKDARHEIAKIEKCPEHLICFDYTLRDIATLKPKTLSKLMDIKGLGEFKVKKFGDVFCEVVRIYEKGGLR